MGYIYVLLTKKALLKQEKIHILIVKLFDNELSKPETVVLKKWLEDDIHLSYFNKYIEFNHLPDTKEQFNCQRPFEKFKLYLYQKIGEANGRLYLVAPYK